MAGNFSIIVEKHGVGLEMRARAKSGRALLAREAQDLARATKAAMVVRMPAKTGRLRRSVQTNVDVKFGGRSTLGTFLPGVTWEAKVYTYNPYAKDVDQGTGVFGPSHKVIKPQNGNVFMMFKEPNALRIERYVTVNGNPVAIYNHSKRRVDKKTGQSIVFTRYIKGQQGHHFTEAAYRAAKSVARRMEEDFADRTGGD